MARAADAPGTSAIGAPPYQQSAAEVVAALGSDAARGLSSAEARARLARYGPNALRSAPPVPAWRRFLAQFRNVLVLLLLVATAISFALWLVERDTALPYESLAIFAIVLFNAILGFVQETRADQAVAALRAMSAARASVWRDGVRQSVATTDLVPGDVIWLEEGDTVPADARLLEATALETLEAPLTGESLPVPKDTAPIAGEVPLGDRRNMVFSGTAIGRGHARAIVVATGMQTELGRIAGLLEDAPPETTPLQRELDRTGRLLGVAVLVIAAVIVGTILVVEGARSPRQVVDALLFGVALAVAAVPEGLPAVVTAVLALGVQRMARRRAIVRRLPAVETLGSATVIASDKTGTLTRNEMTVRAVVTASGRVDLGGTGYTPEGEVRISAEAGDATAVRDEVEWTLRAADLASNATLQHVDGRWLVQGDPTEGALRVAARKVGLVPEELQARFPRLGEVPFSSERKLMSTLHADTAGDARWVVFVKGAADVLLDRCTHELVGRETRPLTKERRAAIHAANERLAAEALRTLGVAYRPLPTPPDGNEPRPDESLERDLVFLGLVGMLDPPRQEVGEAVATAGGAGIRPIMITGDHPATAATIARELGIAPDGRTVTGAELDKLSDDILDQIVREVSVYARVSPHHKLRLVQALQRQGEVVAMTGDGVNDAPALKTADIGIAMGITGTDVSKEAADMVLADDNFATIVAAVEEGRAILANIQKFLRYLLSSNIGEVLTMFVGVLLAGTLGLADDGSGVVVPLLATQILWINLVTDGPPALALGVDPPDPGLMRQPPRPPGSPIITRQMWGSIAFVGAIMAAGTLFMLDLARPGGLLPGTGDLPYARTLAFTTLMLFQVFNVFNARSDTRSAFAGLFCNRWLWGAVGLSLALQVLVTYLPPLQAAFGTVALQPGDWLLCAAVASSVLWLSELRKLVAREV